MEQKTEASQAVDEQVLPHLPRAVGYRHTMDNTEGLKGNKPVLVFCATKPNPFGIPGLDYSASFPVTTETLFTADQMKAYAHAALKAQPAPTEAWTKQAPTVQADYWHWNGDEDAAPSIVSVLYSGSARKCFVTMNCTYSGQAEMCDKYGGWWMRIEQPGLPGNEAQPSGNSGELAQGEDSARLEFMMRQEAWIAWSKDGESCRVFHRDEEGDTGPIMGWIPEAWFHDPREAIDRARASAETGGVKP